MPPTLLLCSALSAARTRRSSEQFSQCRVLLQGRRRQTSSVVRRQWLILVFSHLPGTVFRLGWLELVTPEKTGSRYRFRLSMLLISGKPCWVTEFSLLVLERVTHFVSKQRFRCMDTSWVNRSRHHKRD